MRVTVIGSGPAAPQPDTAASGHLVDSGDTAVLFDCGYGVIGRLRRMRDPLTLAGVVIGHFHADHFIDLAALRYLHPWPGADEGRPKVWLPPGGRARLTALAALMSERSGFFDDAFEIAEYASDTPFEIGGLTVRPSPMHHYVPAWAMSVNDRLGNRLVYAGDTGPTEQFLEVARGADLLVAEATLESAEEDELDRGHCTAEEAIVIGEQAGVKRLMLTHYPSARRAQITSLAEEAPMRTTVAEPGVRVEVGFVERDLIEPGALPDPAPSPAFPGRVDLSRASR